MLVALLVLGSFLVSFFASFCCVIMDRNRGSGNDDIIVGLMGNI
jgi:hypothetical protein